MAIYSSDHQENDENNVIEKNSSGVTVAASCIAWAYPQGYMLLVEIETNVPSVEVQQVIAIRISDEEAKKLMETGVDSCEFGKTIPQTRPGFEANYMCTIMAGEQVIMVFDTAVVVPGAKHQLVLFNGCKCPVVGGG